MSNEFEALHRQWQKDKGYFENESPDINEVFLSIRKKKTWSIHFHYGNILVLLIVLIGITAFFYFVAPVEHLLSRIGVGLMIGGLIVRISIEIISVYKSKAIDMMDSALQATNDTITFYNFRKTIHGPITIAILILYTIGFYMITPEFSLYFTIWKMILIDVSYVVAAIIPFVSIRKNIKKEIKILQEIIALKEKITERNP